MTLDSGSSIEGVSGGRGNDKITGNDLANTLRGNGGDDTLIGGAGGDTYLFAAQQALGTDTIDESGGGADWLNFNATSGVGVTVDLSDGAAQVVSGSLTLILGSGATIEHIRGGRETTR